MITIINLTPTSPLRMNNTITTEELLALTKSADLLRQTAEQALCCDSLARELHDVRNDRDHLAGILEKIAHVFDDPDEGPENFHQLPQAVERLRLKCESLKREGVTAGNHSACRLNVLKDIHRTLGSDGGTTGVNALTGMPPQMTRLPKRIEQLLADVTTWRERYGMMIAENGELVRENGDLVREVFDLRATLARMDERVGDLVRENETLARNMPPEPPVVMTYDPACFRTTKVIGQAWCKTDRATNSAIRFNMHNDCIVLCDVHRDTTTGALTYRPLAMEDLPVVQ